MQQETYRAIPDEPTKQNYAAIMEINHINLDMQYSGDVSKASTDHSYMQQEITSIPDEITKHNQASN